MSKNTSFSVGEQFTSFIAALVSESRYSNASDVVRSGQRLLEEQETRLAALRTALVRGEDSGVSTRGVEDIWGAVKERTGATRGQLRPVTQSGLRNRGRCRILPRAL